MGSIEMRLSDIHSENIFQLVRFILFSFRQTQSKLEVSAVDRGYHITKMFTVYYFGTKTGLINVFVCVFHEIMM